MRKSAVITFFFLAVITFKMTPVATQSANWNLAQFQVTDTFSQINPTNWTAEQYKEFSLVVSSYVRSTLQIILSSLPALQINIFLTAFTN